ncbi:MAG TPA: response regulator [Candidatus Eisenbacteria bacterium]|nr:response regulator [Candidatus Eisenbacteria bacterium]
MKTILVVDDDLEDLMMLEQALLDQGYQVVAQSDAEQAIRQAKAIRPDLIILDEVMPKLFGSEVSERLAQDPRTRDIPVVFLTSLKMPDEPLSPAAANVVIAKSEDPTVLLETISNYL